MSVVRMTGLVSNMDTESIIKELMSAQSYKKTKLQNKITELGWKQDKWKDLNTKIYSLYTGSLSKLRLQGNYNTLKASSSDESKLSVTASNSAPAGTHSLEIQQLASGQYVTSGVVKDTNGSTAVTNGTKLSALGFDTSAGITLTIKGSRTSYLDVGSTTTVYDFTQACKDAGLNASYDSNQHRFFISSKESGTANSFTMTAASSDQAKQRNTIRDNIDYAGMSTSQRDTVDSALLVYTDPVAVDTDKNKAKSEILTNYDNRVRVKYISDYEAKQTNIDTAKTQLQTELKRDPTTTELNNRLATNASSAADTEYQAWVTNPTVANNVFTTAATNLDTLLSSYASASSATTSQSGVWSKLQLAEITRVNPSDSTSAIVTPDTSLMTYIASSDSIINLDNTTFTGSSNTTTINGMTLNLKALSDSTTTETGDPPVSTTTYKPVKFTVSNDTDSVYNMIKGFVKSYNDVLSTLNTAYDAETAKGYEPLTDDQKEAMSDSEIEKWETKIKDSLLRRDGTIESLTSAMRTDLSNSVTVDGKKYSLASFGVGSANYTENGQLHINGDADDSLVSDQDNKLKAALESDPDTVTKVFSQLTSKLYGDLTDRMKSTTLRSALTFYNDKEIKKQITDYKGDLSDLEDKLNDIENNYYKQFSAMETAMAKLNSQSSSLSSMLGR